MNRSTLARRTALRRGAPPARRTRIRPVSTKRAAEARARIVIREAVFRRDGWRCQMPGWHGPCFGTLSVHHLQKASQGGRFEESNLLSLCQRHNDLIETHPAEARALGLVRSASSSPAGSVSDHTASIPSSPPTGPAGAIRNTNTTKEPGQVRARQPGSSTRGGQYQ